MPNARENWRWNPARHAQPTRATITVSEFIAAVAAPVGRLRLKKHDESDLLYAAIKDARAKLAALRGR